MNFKFSKDSDDSQHQEAPGEKKKQGVLLVILLILVGGFAYLYLFTGLIKPNEAQKPAEAPAPAPQVDKLPLPPREGEPAKPDAKSPEKTEVPKAVTTAPEAGTVPAAKPATAPTAKTAPAPAPSKPIEEPKKAVSVKPADKQPLPARIADKKGENIAVTKAEAKKPAVADKKVVPAKEGVKKPVSAGQAKPKTVAQAKKDGPGSWSLIVGNYVLEEALSADMSRVRKAGFKPIVKPAGRKKTAMNRLLVSESIDRATSLSTMDKLTRHTSDAFVIEQGGRFTIYAGSYLQSESARTEKERLEAAGFTTTLKHVDIAIPSQSLSIGPFKSKKEADAALGRLKSAGIKATLSQK